MDLDNQNSATVNDNIGSATPGFDSSIDTTKLDEKPSIDANAINEAVITAEGSSPKIQNTFNVNDISLSDVPTTQEELDRRLDENPNMNLAGDVDATVNPSNTSIGEQQIGAVDMGISSGENIIKTEGASAASFVDGDIVDGGDDSGAITDAAAAADAALDEKASKNPAHIANTITVPKPKSKMPIYIAIGVVVIIAIIAVVIYVITH